MSFFMIRPLLRFALTGLLLITAVSPVLAALEDAPWSDAVRLSSYLSASPTDPFSSAYVSVAVDGSGTAIALYRARLTTNMSVFETWYHTRVDGVWSDSAVLPNPSGSITMQSAELVTLADGNVLAVWPIKDGTDDDTLYYNIWDHQSRSWGSGAYVIAAGDDWFERGFTPEVHATPDGAVVLFASKQSTRRLVWVRYNRTTDSWAAPIVSTTSPPIYDNNSLEAVVDATGMLYAFIPDYNNDDYYAVTIAPNDTESAPQLVSTARANDEWNYFHHIAAFRSSAGVIVSWTDANTDQLSYRIHDGTGWLPEAQLIDSAFPNAAIEEMPGVAVDADDNITVMVARAPSGSGSTAEIAAISSDGRPDIGGSWGDWQVLSDITTHSVNHSKFAAVTTPDGDVGFTYGLETLDSADIGSIWVAVRSRTGAWVDPVEVSSLAADRSQFAALAFDAANRPTVAWEWTDFSRGSQKQVAAAEFFAALTPPTPLNPAEPGAAARPLPQCLSAPDLAVQQLTELTTDRPAELLVTVRNQHNQVHGTDDILISLSDGLTVTDATPGTLNLGQRVALQGLTLLPNETRSFTATISAAAGLPATPIFVAEIYCGGRVLLTAEAPLGGPAAAVTPAIGSGSPTDLLTGAALSAESAATPSAIPAEGAAAALPITLPNTGAAALPLLWLPALIATLFGVVLRSRR